MVQKTGKIFLKDNLKLRKGSVSFTLMYTWWPYLYLKCKICTTTLLTSWLILVAEAGNFEIICLLPMFKWHGLCRIGICHHFDSDSRYLPFHNSWLLGEFSSSSGGTLKEIPLKSKMLHKSLTAEYYLSSIILKYIYWYCASIKIICHR